MIKELWAVKEFNALSAREKAAVAYQWSDILQWEINRVRPEVVFCVGGKAGSALRRLVKERRVDLAGAHLHQISHYAAPQAEDAVGYNLWAGMLDGALEAADKRGTPAASAVAEGITLATKRLLM